MVLRRDSFFPSSSFLGLREQRGTRWAELLDRINHLPAQHPEVIAFQLTIDRLRREQPCSSPVCTEPFCARCVEAVIGSFDGDDDDFMGLYHRNLVEVKFTIRAMRARRRRTDSGHEVAERIA